MKFTREAKAILRKIEVTEKDVYKSNSTCYGTRYGLYNDFYLVDGIFYGYTKREIYHALVKKLFEKMGLDIQALEN